MNQAIQLIIFMILLVVLSPLLGKYMAKVFMGERHFMQPVFGWLEKSVYKVSGIKSAVEKTSRITLLILSVVLSFWDL